MGSGRIRVVIHHGGKCRTRKVNDRETGRRLAGALEERLARSDFRLPTADDLAPTLKTYAEQWLAAARGNLKASTVYFYATHLEQHIYPVFGPRRVSALRRSDCRELVVVCRGKGFKVGTVRGVVRTLSTILT